jgi:molybdopterin/thiamine biosynthesis adenylyltransferase
MSNKVPRRPRAKRPVRPSAQPSTTYLTRASRAGPGDVVARVPELRDLPDQTIAMFGLGALGAPAALEFARAGVGALRLFDQDIVEAGNIVRWPLGISEVGKAKAQAIGQFIFTNYPYTQVSGHIGRIGGVRTPTVAEGPTELEWLDTNLDGADLIYDATAEPGVWHALSDLARERDIPYLHTWATAGAWGGVVARVLPNRPGCWMCLEHHTNDATIPAPNADPAGGIQPPGCADPTFTGASFDLAEITLAGVRLAIATLLLDKPDRYPDVPWDVAVINLRDTTGTPHFDVQTFPLTAHPSCQRCGT